MARKVTAPVAGDGPTVTHRWWVDLGGTEKVKVKRPPGPAGSRFFQVAHDFEQERAREHLTDNNLKLVSAANPPAGGWGYVRLGESTYPRRELDRIKRLVALPPYARGVIVDCGRSVRLLVTGSPAGERLLELALGDAPSFDCWVHHEWVREEVFTDADKALRSFRRYVAEYLSPEGVAQAEAIAARA
ncbi:MAG: hypothetical protein ACE5I7_13290 [Candidatus Binatia bacterium]